MLVQSVGLLNFYFVIALDTAFCLFCDHHSAINSMKQSMNAFVRECDCVES